MDKRKVIVNFSGGKDSTVAILEALKVYPKDEIVLCFQDTGAEYLETEAHVKKIAEMVDLPILVLRRDKNFWDLVREQGHFPLANYRFCSSMLKYKMLRKWIQDNRKNLGTEVIVVSGLRAEESRERYKMPVWSKHEVSLKEGFTAWNWRPCHQMTQKEIYERIKAEGLPLHPCYDFSTRLSCWCCIFAHPNEVRPYAEAHPELYEKACLIEDEIKCKWKPGFALNDLMKQGRLF
jgi:3'-phosphoadenosine 5'-phosphosulfate sulfotransferase (PAPS reductase)/FAD synthetase